MNPHFFFEGKLSREESASAFLATLLEGRADFRSFLFRMMEIAEPPGPVQVRIEKDEIDIRLDYPGAKTVILIENKIRPGALQVNQLVNYYRKVCGDPSDSWILSILVPPSPGYGAGETTRLAHHHKQFRPTDTIRTVPWGTLAEFCSQVPREDADGEFVHRGFEIVLGMIKKAFQEKYPLVGGREIAQDIAQTVCNVLMNECTDMPFRCWRGKDFFNIYSVGTDLTVYVDLAFRVADTKPFAPLDIHSSKDITATLRTQFSLSAKGKHNPALKEQWGRLCQQKLYDVPGNGPHELVGRWFKREEPFSGDAKLLEQRLTEMGRALVNSVRHLERTSGSGG